MWHERALNTPLHFSNLPAVAIGIIGNAFWLTCIPWLQPLFAEIGRFVAYTRRAIRRAAEDCAAPAADGAVVPDGADSSEAAAAMQRVSPAACNAADGAPAQGPGEGVLQREASSQGVASPSRGTGGPAACFSISDDDTPKVQLCAATKYTCCHVFCRRSFTPWRNKQGITAENQGFFSVDIMAKCRQAPGNAVTCCSSWQHKPSMPCACYLAA